MAKDWWKNSFNSDLGKALFSDERIFKPSGKRTAEEVNLILKNGRIEKTSRILDLACGVGRHSIPLARKGFQVVGLDYSRAYIEQARKIAKHQRLKNATFVCEDMRNAAKTFGVLSISGWRAPPTRESSSETGSRHINKAWSIIFC